jgi:hypothetical protein
MFNSLASLKQFYVRLPTSTSSWDFIQRFTSYTQGHYFKTVAQGCPLSGSAKKFFKKTKAYESYILVSRPLIPDHVTPGHPAAIVEPMPSLMNLICPTILLEVISGHLATAKSTLFCWQELDDPIQLLEAPFPSQPGLVPNFR